MDTHFYNIRIWQPVPPYEHETENIAEEPVSDKSLFGSLILRGNEVIGDVSSLSRTFFVNTNKFYGTHDPKVVDAMGVTSAFSTLSGSLNIAKGVKEIEVAKQIADREGKWLGVLKVVQGALFTITGIIYIPIRTLSVLALSRASKILRAASEQLGRTGSGFFSLGMVFSLISLGSRLHDYRLFRKEFKTFKDPKKSFQFLKEKITLSREEKEQLKKNLDKETYKQEKKAVLARKEAHLRRLVGQECVDSIRNNTVVEADEVIASVQKASRAKVILAGLSFGLVCITLGCTILSFVFTTPLVATLIACIGIAVSVGWLCIDAHSLIQEFKKCEPGRYDKLWIFFSSVLALICISCVFFLSSGLYPIIIASVIGGLWLTVNLGAYAHLFYLNREQRLQVTD